MRNVTQDLQDTLLKKPKIKTVYFDASGKHYFRVFELIQDKDATGGKKFYGDGLFSHKTIIPGDWNVDKLKETHAKGDPKTLIVDQMTRDEILNEKVSLKATGLIEQITNAPESEKSNILSALGLTPEAIKMMNDLATKKEEKAPTLTAKKEDKKEDKKD